MHNGEHMPGYVFYALKVFVPFSFYFAVFGFWYEYSHYEQIYGKKYVAWGLVLIFLTISPFLFTCFVYGWRKLIRLLRQHEGGDTEEGRRGQQAVQRGDGPGGAGGRERQQVAAEEGVVAGALADTESRAQLHELVFT